MMTSDRGFSDGRTPQFTETLQPERLLQQLSTSGGTGCFKVTVKEQQWFLYFDQGNIVYATHTIEPSDRFERHLRQLSQVVPALDRKLRVQVRQQWQQANTPTPIYEYESLRWLLTQDIITLEHFSCLVEGLIVEVLESFLYLKSGHHQLVPYVEVPIVSRFDATRLIQQCKSQIQQWLSLGHKIVSPFQRPYFFSSAQVNLTPEQQQRLGSMLRGFSFRHLAVLMNQNEIALVRSLLPLIDKGAVVIREPQHPFDLLPSFDASLWQETAPTVAEESGDLSSGFFTSQVQNRTYRIVCIDDSPTMLNEIKRFLADDAFEVITLNDSVKALMEVMRLNPDLILLDVGMPNIDGYKFCKVIRNHERFKSVPIIMVTGNTGLIDRAKARLVGATDYMTKPFTQAELLKMVFQYLT
ncbi:MAG TPA: response regulator [Thermosynechococcus sp. M98_K2018_005]|uniref:response regulator n=1 Tax=Thermosynechococcus sp. M98_K2018_005 TaxID=2747811 RepID=UPI0019FCFC9D|nr:response regulator [Thermosynechococcus sp. M98_K2018_005]HIK35606.1 response regulator [Thermosynechococcus sp. M98_K2018_005]